MLTLLGVLLTGPFLWLFITSLKAGQNVFKLKELLDLFPLPLTLENFSGVWKEIPLIPSFFLNTLWLCLWGVLMELVLASLAAYPLARMDFPGKGVLFGILLSTLMLPAQVNMIVNFITIRKLGLFDTYTAVLLPGLVSIFGIFLMRQAYLVIPREIDDAARIDGCNDFTIWLKILLPLTKPSLATLSVFSFVGYWNTFIWPLIILKREAKYPLAVGLSYLSNIFASDFRLVAAGCVLSIIPVILLFLLAQKQFIGGITAGAVK